MSSEIGVKFVRVMLGLVLSLTLVNCSFVGALSFLASPTPTATHTPTETPTPSVTPTATPSPIEKFEGPGFQIYLPGSYIRAGEGAGGAEIAEALGVELTAGQDIPLIAIDTTGGRISSDSITSLVMILSVEEQALTLFTLPAIAELFVSQFELSGMDIQESVPFTIQDYEAHRFIAFGLPDVEDTIANPASVFYLVKRGAEIWLIFFITSEDQLEARLPDYDASAQSFEFVE